jgi:hypothetical protein
VARSRRISRCEIEASAPTGERRVHVLLEDILGVAGVVARRADPGLGAAEMASGGLPLALDLAQIAPLRRVVERRPGQRAIHLALGALEVGEVCTLALLHVAAAGEPGRLQVLEQGYGDRRFRDHLVGELLRPVRGEQQQEAADQRPDEHGPEHSGGEHEEAAMQRGQATRPRRPFGVGGHRPPSASTPVVTSLKQWPDRSPSL